MAMHENYLFRTRTEANPLQTLITLRYWAACGQLLAIAAALLWLELTVSWIALAAGPLALLLFNLRIRFFDFIQADTPSRILRHLAFDIGELSYVIALSGGVMNPFSSLFLVPVALATLVLPARYMGWVAGLASLGYGLSAWVAYLLPHIHGLMALHLWGMAANFLLSGVVFVVVLTRLAAARQKKDSELASLKEFAARARGLTYLASHTAALAHGLNTPLGTLSLALEDALDDARKGVAIDPDDLAHALALVHLCRDQVRILVRDAQARSASEHQDDAHVCLGELTRLALERWQILRPDAQLQSDFQVQHWQDFSIAHASSFTHLIYALLDNAADASLLNQEVDVWFDLQFDQSQSSVLGRVRDRGGKSTRSLRNAQVNLFASDKHTGLGLGLAVCQLSIAQWQGALWFESAMEGTVACFRIPIEQTSKHQSFNELDCASHG
jgi:two-component system, sensor histidine kinase RegB